MSTPQRAGTTNSDSAFWSIDLERHLERLQTSAAGIEPSEAEERIKRFRRQPIKR